MQIYFGMTEVIGHFSGAPNAAIKLDKEFHNISMVHTTILETSNAVPNCMFTALVLCRKSYTCFFKVAVLPVCYCVESAHSYSVEVDAWLLQSSSTDSTSKVKVQ